MTGRRTDVALGETGRESYAFNQHTERDLWPTCVRTSNAGSGISTACDRSRIALDGDLMNRWLMSGPSLDVAEVAVVLAAFLFLTVVPLAFRAAEAHRRRRSQPMGAAVTEVPLRAAPVSVPSREGVIAPGARALSPAATVSSFEPALGAQAGPAPADEELFWPTTPPSPSVDPWHPEEEGGLSAEGAGVQERPEQSGAEDRDTELERGRAREGEEPVSERTYDTRDSQEPPSSLASPMAQAETWPGPPVREVSALLALPQAGGDGKVFRLSDLRQATLPSWPRADELGSPQSYRIWRTAEELWRRFSRQLLERTVATAHSVVSFSLGRVETDGKRYRLHLWLFEELWPVSPEEVVAVAVADLDPNQGLLGLAVVERSPPC